MNDNQVINHISHNLCYKIDNKCFFLIRTNLFIQKTFILYVK